MTFRGERCHVKNIAHFDPAAAHVALSLALATVVRERSKADESGNAAAIEPAQFREPRQKGKDGYFANARYRLQQVGFDLPNARGPDFGGDVDIQGADTLRQPFDVFLQAWLRHRERRRQSRLFLRPHRDQLASPIQQLGQFALLGARYLPDLRSYPLTE